jgi:hypothetical protein
LKQPKNNSISMAKNNGIPMARSNLLAKILVSDIALQLKGLELLGEIAASMSWARNMQNEPGAFCSARK